MIREIALVVYPELSQGTTNECSEKIDNLAETIRQITQEGSELAHFRSNICRTLNLSEETPTEQINQTLYNRRKDLEALSKFRSLFKIRS
jgi:hypothetical protein